MKKLWGGGVPKPRVTLPPRGRLRRPGRFSEARRARRPHGKRRRARVGLTGAAAVISPGTVSLTGAHGG